MNPDMTKAILYLRIASNARERADNGFEAQERCCRNYAKSRNYDVEGVFCDQASGNSESRPGMTALLDFLRKQPPRSHAVLIEDISRLARDLAISARLRDAIHDAGGVVEYVTETRRDESGQGFVEKVLLAASQHEEMLRKRNRSTAPHAKEATV